MLELLIQCQKYLTCTESSKLPLPLHPAHETVLQVRMSISVGGPMFAIANPFPSRRESTDLSCPCGWAVSGVSAMTSRSSLRALLAPP